MPRLRNIRHERFAVAVAALTPHPTAYREAGYVGDEKWHRYNASRLAGLPQVAARIEELVTERERTCAHVNVVHADYVRSKLIPLIEADVRELYEPDPDRPGRLRLRDMQSLPSHVTQSIARLKLDAETGKPAEIMLANKTEAAGMLLRSLPGGVVERRELVGKDGEPLFGEMTDEEFNAHAITQSFELFAKLGFSAPLLADFRTEFEKIYAEAPDHSASNDAVIQSGHGAPVAAGYHRKPALHPLSRNVRTGR
jgi:hypothetical protein